MPRLGTKLARPRSVLMITCVVLAIASVLPGRALPMVPWLSGVVELLVAPVQRPLAHLVVWLRGPAPGVPSDEGTRALLAELDAWKVQARVSEARVLDLERQLAVLQRGLGVLPTASVRQLVAPVIGFGSDAGSAMLKVQAGSSSGVLEGSVAAVDAVNLLGRVSRVEGRLCRVTPITDRGAGTITARIFTDEVHGAARSGAPAGPAGVDVLGAPGGAGANASGGGGASLQCKLSPAGGALMSGPVEWLGLKPGEAAVAVTPGMMVRLSDATWPLGAQMLAVGRVESVQTSDSGRTIVSVRVGFDLPRVSEVTIRVTGDEGAAPADPGAAGGGR